MIQTNTSLNITHSIASCGDKPVPIATIKYTWVWYAVLSLYGLLILFLWVQRSPTPLPKVPIIQAELWQDLPSLQVAPSPVTPKSVNLQSDFQLNSPVQTVPIYTQKKQSSTKAAIVKNTPAKQSAPILKSADKVVVTPSKKLPSFSSSKITGETISSVKKPVAVTLADKTSNKIPDKDTNKDTNKNTNKDTNKDTNRDTNKSIDKKNDLLKNMADAKAKDTIAAVIAKEAAYFKRIDQMKVLASSNMTTVSNRPHTASIRDLGAGWGERLKQCVQPNLRYSDVSASNPRVEFMVKLSAMGSPNSVNLTKSSSNNAYDLAVERALRRCDPFPKPVSGEYPLSIRVGYSLNN